MTERGTVRIWHADEGWGVVDGPGVPGGCWVHFSAIAADGYRHLDPGRAVSFRVEPGPQDGYPYRAVKVWTDDREPAGASPENTSPGAYDSRLTLTFDDEAPGS